MPYPTLNIELIKLLSEASPFAARLMDVPGFGAATRALEAYLNTPSDSAKRSRPDRVHMSELQELVLASELTDSPFTHDDIKYLMNVIQNTGLGAIKCADIHNLELEHSTEDTLEIVRHVEAGNPHAAERARTLVMFYKLDPAAQLHPTPSDEALANNPMAATAPLSPADLRTMMPAPGGGTESVEAAIARAARPRPH